MEDIEDLQPETVSRSYENTSRLVKRGFRVWSNNLKIALPHLLQPILVGLWSATALVALLLVAAPPPELLATGPNTDPATLTPLIRSYLSSVFPAALSLGIIWFVITTLISSTLEAGAIGMAIEANELYRCSIRDAFEYGKNYGLSLFLANMITMGIILMTAGFISLPIITTKGFTQQALQTPLVFFPIVAALVIGFVFLPVKYSLVAEGTGPVNAVRDGAAFTLTHPLPVLALLGVTLLVSLLVDLPGQQLAASGTPGALAAGQLYSVAAGALFTAPFTTTLWTRLYLDRTDQKLVEQGGLESLN